MIKDLGLENVEVKGRYYVGGVTGINAGRVYNSYVEGDVTGKEEVGGLVGCTDSSSHGHFHGKVNNSYAKVDVSGNLQVGGLVGEGGEGCAIYNSFFTGNTSGTDDVGGLIGENHGTIENSHYNVDEVLINDKHHITRGALFDEQYNDWSSNNLSLDIADYSDTLVPSGDRYEINSVDGMRDLLGFAEDEEYSFHLTSDVGLSSEPGLYIPYLGARFNGDGHTLSNLHLDLSFSNPLGMFGYLNGTIANLGVVDVNVAGTSYVGGLVGEAHGIVKNSYTTGYVSGKESVGGLIGRTERAVNRSYSTCEVDGDLEVGGLVGVNYDSVLNRSYATGPVQGNESVGGLVGSNKGIVNDSHATGKSSGNDSIGGLVGRNKGWINYSYTSGDVSGKNLVGGLVGFNEALINHTYSNSDVSGVCEVGGLVGHNHYSSRISRSHAIGNVRGTDEVGGLLGQNRYDGVVSNTYARGDVEGKRSIGGLVGRNRYGGKVRNSYAAGQVSGDESIGGFVGNNSGQIADCFWDIGTSGIEKSDGGKGKTTAEMKDVATYTDYPDVEGLWISWDFVGDPNSDSADKDIWDIDENEEINNGYPFLTWQDVEEDADDQNDDGDKEGDIAITEFTMILLLLILVVVIAIYYGKKR